MLTVFKHTSHQESQHMLTQEEDVDIHAMQRRGWTVSATARHTGHDRKTVRVYTTAERRAPLGHPYLWGMLHDERI